MPLWEAEDRSAAGRDDGVNPPPAHALANRGIIDNVVGYTVYGDYTEENPPARVIDAVAKGEIDVASAWGPLAGYLFAGILALLMRIQLAWPENSFIGPDLYNQLFTVHGTTMMFLFAVPITEAFGLYFVPLTVGTRPAQRRGGTEDRVGVRARRSHFVGAHRESLRIRFRAIAAGVTTCTWPS